MSFDIYLQAFQDGEPRLFERRIVEDAFAGCVATTEPDSITLRFDEVQSAELRVGAGAQIDGFSVNRPPSHPRFWSGLLEIMRSADAVLYWPGGVAAANARLVAHLPTGMTDEMDTVAVVARVEELSNAIKGV